MSNRREKKKRTVEAEQWKQVLQMLDLLDTVLTKVDTITVIVRFKEMDDNLEDFS